MKLKKYQFTSFFMAAILLTGGIASGITDVYADSATGEKVKIGYYPWEDFQEGTSDGTAKSGYSYEYIQEVASYTGWDYQYVYGEWEDLYQKLESGEIDLLAGVAYSEECAKQVSYPSYDMLNETFYIYKDSKDDSMKSGNYDSFAGKKIGTVDAQRMTSKLEEWAKDNRADIEIEYYKDISECAEDFNVGELDGFVSADNIVSSYSGITPVEIIGKEPYYLAVANDRSDLLEELNEALTQIHEQNAFYLDFLNIVGNAVKYNKPGGKIDWRDEMLYTEETGVLYKCSIADTGIGMDKEFLQHIFEPFSQEKTDARTVYQGTGLGMSIVKTLVERMDGTITIDSEPGKGSTVCITVPFKISQKSLCRENDADTNDDKPLADRKILLVEDNDLNLEIAQFILEDAGAVVVTARNGKAAVDTYMAKPSGTYDAILMDIMMPVMNGNEATEKIRRSGWADAERIPIIAVTACVEEEIHTAGMRVGINGYVMKPLNAELLIKTLSDLIQNKKQ